MPFQNNIFPNLTPPVPGAVLLEVYVYGEGQTNDKLKNLRGQIYRHKDGGGLQQINDYDFNGNPLQTQQQLLNDATLTDVDWDESPVLATETFTSSVTYDALNRPVTQTDPGSNIQAFTYDKGGLLKTVTLNNDDYVNDIHYDAKGQRQAIWYGNGTKTSYTYDPDTFRLRRLLTVNLSTNVQLQDLNYYYDPVGNITTIRDDAQQTLFFNNSVVSPTQAFTYDALYRLITATGRELKGTASFGSEDNWNDAPWMGQPQPNNGSAVQTYTQHYTYDAVGNILSLQHTAGTGSYTRTYDVDMASNKLLSTTVGSNTYHYTHDARGNMLTMPHLQAMGWNALNELYTITQGTTVANYQYSAGQRIRKYMDKGSIKEERIYFGNFELYRKFDGSSSLKVERQTVHVSDDTGRIVMLEVRTQGTDASLAELTRYIYSNHLQSASLELDESSAIISYEEYHPYGTTSYQAMNASIKAVAKRYRYTGKERDEESGLYYHGARYYIPWLCRWTSIDALQSEMPNNWSPYNYGFCNPVIFNDPSGNNPEDNGVKISEQGQARLVEMAQNTKQYKDAVKRGDKVILKQNFHIWHNEGVTQSQQELNAGEEGANVFYISQSGYIDIDAQPRYPGGRFEMSFGSDAKLQMPEVQPIPEQSIEELSTPTLSEPTPMTTPKEVHIPPPPTIETTKKQEVIEKKVEIVKKPAVAKNYSDIPGWATYTDKMTSELYSFTYNVANFYKKTDAKQLNITFNIPPNVMTQSDAKDLPGLAGWSKKHKRYSTLSSVQKKYKTNKTHIQNIEGQIKEFGNILRELLPGMKINIHTNKNGTNSSIFVQPVRPKRR